MENKKTGMIFGKINIMDVLIVVLVICAVAFVATRFLGIGESEFARAQTVHITFFGTSSPDFVSPNTNIGDSVWEDHINQHIGRVVSIETGDSIEFEMGIDNRLHQVARDWHESVFITVEARGVVGDNGIVLGGTIFSPGHSTVIYAGWGKYFVRVYSLEIVD